MKEKNYFIAYAYGENKKRQREAAGYTCRPQRMLYPVNGIYCAESIVYICTRQCSGPKFLSALKLFLADAQNRCVLAGKFFRQLTREKAHTTKNNE